jgi:hypothetical protein
MFGNGHNEEIDFLLSHFGQNTFLSPATGGEVEIEGGHGKVVRSEG